MAPGDNGVWRASRIDTLIARGRHVDVQCRADTGASMPAPLIAQLSRPSASAATPATWTEPLLILLLGMVLGGLLLGFTTGSIGLSRNTQTLRMLAACLASGLVGALTGLLVAQGLTLGLRLAKWLPLIGGAACAAQAVAVGLRVAEISVVPPALGLMGAIAAWRLINSTPFSGFVTYRLLLRQARRLRARAGAAGSSR